MELEFRKADVSVYPVEGPGRRGNSAWALDLAGATGGSVLSAQRTVSAFRSARPRAGRILHACLRAASLPGRKLQALKVHREPARRDGARAKPDTATVPRRSWPPSSRRRTRWESLADTAGTGNTAASATRPVLL